MKTTPLKTPDKRFKASLMVAILGAIGASVCCLGPLLLLVLGISGAWISHLSAFEPYRPILSLMTLGFLGFAFYKVYNKPKRAECAPGSFCAHPRSEKRNKIILWIVTALVLGLLAFPDLVPYLFAQTSPQVPVETKQVVLNVKGMTCAACPVTVKKSLTRLVGVQKARVTLTPPEARITFIPQKISIDDLIKATTLAGYPSTLKKKN